MFAQAKKFVIVSVLAVSAGAATLAAPGYVAPQFDPATSVESLVLPSNATLDIYINIAGSALLDPTDQVRLMYDMKNLGDLVQIKQVIAPDGINISLLGGSLIYTRGTPRLHLEFEFTNSLDNSDVYPVQIILENPTTGATTTLNLTVQTD